MDPYMNHQAMSSLSGCCSTSSAFIVTFTNKEQELPKCPPIHSFA